MEQAIFEKLIAQLQIISDNVQALVGGQLESEDKKDEGDKAAKKSGRLSNKEKKRFKEIARIYGHEFKDIIFGEDAKDKKKTDITGKVTINAFSARAMKQLQNTMDLVFTGLIKQMKELEETLKKSRKGGIFGFLKDVIGGAFNAITFFKNLTPYILALGGMAFLFYVVKNIDKIAKSLDIVLKSGKENFPTISESLRKDFLPFLKEMIGPINNLIDKLPILFDILLKNIPTIRSEFTKFINETDTVKLLAIGGALMTLYTAWQTIRTVKSIKDGVTSPLSALSSIANTFKYANLILISGAIVGFSKAWDLFSSAIERYENVKWESLEKAGIAFLAFAGSVYAATKMKVGLDAFLGAAGAAGIGLALAGTLFGLAKALEPWNNVTKNALEGAGLALATVLGALAIFAIPGTGEAAAIGALFGGAGLLVMGGSFMLAIRGLGETFRDTMSVWEKLPGVFKQFEEINAEKLVHVSEGIAKLAGALALSGAADVAKALTETLTNVWRKLTGQKSPVEIIKEYEKIDGEKIKKAADSFTLIINTIKEYKSTTETEKFVSDATKIREAIDKLASAPDLNKVITNIKEFKSLFDEKGNIIAVNPVQTEQTNLPPAQIDEKDARKIKETAEKVEKTQKPIQQPVKANDFVFRPNQPPVILNENDTILGVKDIKSLITDIKNNASKDDSKFNKTIQDTFENMKKELKQHTDILKEISRNSKDLNDKDLGKKVNIINRSTSNNISLNPSYTSSQYRSNAASY